MYYQYRANGIKVQLFCTYYTHDDVAMTQQHAEIKTHMRNEICLEVGGIASELISLLPCLFV